MAASTKKTPKAQAPGMRKKAVKVQGKYLPSVMLRVDLDFANYVRAEARKAALSATAVTRMLYEAFLNDKGAA